MLTYKTNDGLLVQGETARDVIAAMRAASWHPEKKAADFLRETAAMAEMQTGRAIPTAPPEAFIAALVSVGLLKEEPGCASGTLATEVTSAKNS